MIFFSPIINNKDMKKKFYETEKLLYCKVAFFELSGYSLGRVRWFILVSDSDLKLNQNSRMIIPYWKNITFEFT